jgi:hypothetical protein
MIVGNLFLVALTESNKKLISYQDMNSIKVKLFGLDRDFQE